MAEVVERDEVQLGRGDPRLSPRFLEVREALEARAPLQGRLADVAELVAGAAVYAGVDTLVSHIAAAAGTPTVVLFGPSNPMKWAPWPRGHEASVSPFNGSESQQVGNVAFVRNASGSLGELGEQEVLAAIALMHDKSVRESPL